jgi:hypothetical protein
MTLPEQSIFALHPKASGTLPLSCTKRAKRYCVSRWLGYEFAIFSAETVESHARKDLLVLALHYVNYFVAIMSASVLLASA